MIDITIDGYIAGYFLYLVIEIIPPRARDKNLYMKKIFFFFSIDSNEEEMIVIPAKALRVLRGKPRKNWKKKLWVRPWLQRRSQLGVFILYCKKWSVKIKLSDILTTLFSFSCLILYIPQTFFCLSELNKSFSFFSITTKCIR